MDNAVEALGVLAPGVLRRVGAGSNRYAQCVDVYLIDGATLLRAQHAHGRCVAARALANEKLGAGCRTVIFLFDQVNDDMPPEQSADALCILADLDVNTPDVRANQLVVWSNGSLARAWTSIGRRGTNIRAPRAPDAAARTAHWIREYDRVHPGWTYSVTSGDTATLAALLVHLGMGGFDLRTRIHWSGGGYEADLSAMFAAGSDGVSVAALLAAAGADGGPPVAPMAALLAAWIAGGRRRIASVSAETHIVSLNDAELERVAAAAWGLDATATWALVHEARMKDAIARIRALVDKHAPGVPDAAEIVGEFAHGLELGDALVPLRMPDSFASLNLIRAQTTAISRGLAWLSSIYAPLGAARPSRVFWSLVRWVDGTVYAQRDGAGAGAIGVVRARRADAYAEHLAVVRPDVMTAAEWRAELVRKRAVAASEAARVLGPLAARVTVAAATSMTTSTTTTTRVIAAGV